MNESFIFHQLFEKESSTYTYLIGDARTKKAALIDPVLEMAERDLQLVREIMAQKKLAPPKRIQEAVPANLACGRVNA